MVILTVKMDQIPIIIGRNKGDERPVYSGTDATNLP